jgi:tetratricopeptide (TPR) repeat protein
MPEISRPHGRARKEMGATSPDVREAASSGRACDDDGGAGMVRSLKVGFSRFVWASDPRMTLCSTDLGARPSASSVAMKKLSLLTSITLLLSVPSVSGEASAAVVAAPAKGKSKPAAEPAADTAAADEVATPAPAADEASTPSVPVPKTGPVSAAQTAAEDAYAAEKYEEAAVAFAAIAAEKAPGNAARAQFWLGKALFKLEFFAGSFSVFDQIVLAGPAHPMHRLTLPWLASLSRVLPEGAGVLEKVGTYRPEELENEAFDEVRDELYYLLGRYYYHKGDLAQAIALLSQVPNESDFYIPAQWFLGVSETREFRGEPAVAAFKEVLRKNADLKAREQTRRVKREKKQREKLLKKLRRKKDLGMSTAELEFDEQNERFEELANLSMGYIFYQVGKFETGIKYFDRVPQSSPYWLDAVFAAAWSEFRLVEAEPDNANVHYQRALGYIHTLNAPFFYDYLYPEAMTLKAVTYYFNCRFAPAKAAIDEFNSRYKKSKDDLEGVLKQAPEDYAFFELTQKIRAGESGMDPFVEKVARKSLQDRTLEKHYQFVERLESEQARLEKMSPEFSKGPAGEVVSENIDINLSVAKSNTGGLARKRLQARVAEIKKLEREAIKVEYQIIEKLKEVGAESTGGIQRARPDSEHEVYNYNGEYWQDELGFYYYKVNSLCRE